jgi:hypothetical protein
MHFVRAFLFGLGIFCKPKCDEIRLAYLAQRIIVGTKGEITAYGLNSLFVHLRCFTQDLSTPGSGKGGSEHVPLGASISQKPLTDDVEWFLSVLRFDSKEK